MTLASGAALLTNPTTPAQMRTFIAALNGQAAATSSGIDTLTTEVTQLQGQADPIAAVFDSTMGVGAPVKIVSTAHVDFAQADSIAHANVAGLVFAGAASAATGSYVPNGGRASQADWTSIVGAASLTPGAIYYLSATAGKLTTTAPTTSGKVVIKVGRAITIHIMVVEIGVGVLL